MGRQHQGMDRPEFRQVPEGSGEPGKMDKTDCKIILQRHCERGKKTEEEVGRQHQGMDRPEVRQVTGGSREQRKMEETGCEIIRVAPTILAVKGLMMMMMMMHEITRETTIVQIHRISRKAVLHMTLMCSFTERSLSR